MQESRKYNKKGIIVVITVSAACIEPQSVLEGFPNCRRRGVAETLPCTSFNCCMYVVVHSRKGTFS